MSRARWLLLTLLLAALFVACRSASSVRSTPTSVPTAVNAAPTGSATPSPAPTDTGTPDTEDTPDPTATPSHIVPAPVVSGTIGTLVIPALGRTVAIVSVGWQVEGIDGAQVAVWETVADAVGHHRGSAPLGGVGNCVLSGHSSAEQGAVLEGLWELAVGDALDLTDEAGEAHRYRVASVQKVQETGVALEDRLAQAAAMDPTDDARLTLITCWPEWAYTHRVIVTAHLEAD